DGTCFLLTSEMTQDLPLRRNDFVVFTRDAGFVMRDHAGSRLTAIDNRFADGEVAVREAVFLGGNGAETHLLWGRLAGDDDYTKQAFSLLPPLLVAQSEGRDAVAGLDQLLRLLFDEIDNRRPGGELFVDRVLHALFVVALRATPPRLPHGKGLVSALGVPGLG